MPRSPFFILLALPTLAAAPVAPGADVTDPDFQLPSAADLSSQIIVDTWLISTTPADIPADLRYRFTDPGPFATSEPAPGPLSNDQLTNLLSAVLHASGPQAIRSTRLSLLNNSNARLKTALSQTYALTLYRLARPTITPQQTSCGNYTQHTLSGK